MTIRNFILSLSICFVTSFLFSCRSSSNPGFKVIRLDTAIKPSIVSFSRLVDNYKKYQEQYIQVTGKFYESFEEFAIYKDERFFSKDAKGFRLGVDKDLDIDELSFKKMNGKRVTIKGVIDTTQKGHLDSYLATIDSIYFWEQE